MLVMQNRHVLSLKWFFIRVSSIFIWRGRIATIIIWCEKDVRSQSCPTLLDLMDCSTPGLPIHHQLLEFTQSHVHSVGDVIQPSHPLSSPPLPSNLPSIRVFSSESALLIRCPKYWGFSFSISPSNEYSLLICFRMDWLDLLALQGTRKSLLQNHSSKASILWHSTFFIVQHPYMTTGKNIALARWTFVGKVISLLGLIYCLGRS